MIGVSNMLHVLVCVTHTKKKKKKKGENCVCVTIRILHIIAYILLHRDLELLNTARRVYIKYVKDEMVYSSIIVNGETSTPSLFTHVIYIIILLHILQ